MIGLALALIVVGVVFLFFLGWAGIVIGIIGVVLLIASLLGLGRRATADAPVSPDEQG